MKARAVPALAVALLLALAACGSAAPPRAAARTALSITLYPQGVGRPGAVHYSLRCHPGGGTVPDPKRACRVLASLSDPFAPVAKGTICTTLALGPQEARVTGHVGAKRIAARLTVRGGCEIDRWRRVQAVVPGFSGRRPK